MEVVKVFNRDGESYQRFEQDVGATGISPLAWYKVCWPLMAPSTTASCPCVALVHPTSIEGAPGFARGQPTPPDFSPWCCACPSMWSAPAACAGGLCPLCLRSITRSPHWSSWGGAGSGTDRRRLLRCGSHRLLRGGPLCLSGGRSAPRRLPHRAGGGAFTALVGRIGQRQVHPGKALGPLLRCDRREHPRGRPGISVR